MPGALYCRLEGTCGLTPARLMQDSFRQKRRKIAFVREFDLNFWKEIV
jgi:hypothetical protein